MKTNFEHLRKYGKVFDYITKAEEILTTAKDNIEIENGFTCMRKSLEGMIIELGKAYQIDWGENHTLFERINYLGTLRFMDPLTIKDLHFIRKGCNCQSHYNEFEQNLKLYKQVYNAYYRQSYRIVAGYLEGTYRPQVKQVYKPQMQPAYQPAAKQSYQPQPKGNAKAWAWGIGLMVAGYAFFMLMIISSF